MKQLRILIVDDNIEICNLVVKYAQTIGFEAEYLTNSSIVMPYLKDHKYELIILDVAMPNLDGYNLYKQIKKVYNTPVMFLSAKAHIDNRLKGLNLGAEDYIVKPFSLEELFIKINNILKRKPFMSIAVDDFIFDQVQGTVVYQNKRLKLTFKEYQLLLYLVNNKNHVVSREEIMSEVWGYEHFLDSQTVVTHIKEIRKQTGSSLIKTVRGKGYVYENN